jgi:hypothetical protein
MENFPEDLSRESESSAHSCDKKATEEAEASEPEHTIAKQETRDVFRLRLVVALVLVASAIGVALSVYFYLTHSEEKQFRQKYEDDANTLFDTIGSIFDQCMEALDSVAVTMVSTAEMTNQSWPFVTMANFAVRMSKILPLSHAVSIVAYHVVLPEEREKWEEYAATHNYWVNESVTVQKAWGGYHGTLEFNREQSPAISGNFGDIPRNER